MIYELKNEDLRIRVKSMGGELTGIRSADGMEFLWQGDAAYWKGQSPHLFPFVGRLVDKEHRAGGKIYRLPIHGFLPETEMNFVEISDARLVLRVEDSQKTRAVFPYAFLFDLIYVLEEKTLSITFRVKNTGGDYLHFGIGGHPGFNVPLAGGLAFTDYCLEFTSGGCSKSMYAEEYICAERILFSDAGFMTGKTEPFPLLDGTKLPLSHSLFDRDAVVLQNTGGCVTLRSDKSPAFVRVEYPGMPYIGFWHKPHSDAPYVCIEPWVSLPAREGETTCFEEREDLIHLRPGMTYENTWKITCCDSEK